MFNLAFTGKLKAVAVYDLAGKMVGMKTFSKNSVDLRKDFILTEGVFVVRVTIIGER
jgi:myo-inositol-hexaphosphate 3-phosphohydrolase